MSQTIDTEAAVSAPRYDAEPDHYRSARRPRRFRLNRTAIIAILLVAIAIVVYLIVRNSSAKNSANYITAPVTRTTINATIQETGTINPVNQVQVGTQVSGTIAQLNVDYNSLVHKGQVLAQLDPTSFEAAAAQAHANLAAAQSQSAASASTVNQQAAAAQSSLANVQQLRANLSAAQANVQKAAAQENLSRLAVSRDRSLLGQGFISQSQMDTDQATENSNLQSLRAAQAAYQAAQQQVSGAAAQVSGARAGTVTSENQAGAAQAQIGVAAAQAQQADYNLSRTVIRSPIDGIVVSRAVSVGQTVAASLQTPTLFVIASSLKDMQVDVSVDEADVGQLRKGQSADITVPAFPNVDFHGIVQQVRVNPTTVQNVVTYDAVVTVHDEQARLKPGMTANITISVLRRNNVLAVPLAALLFRPASARAAASGTGAGAGAQGGANSGAAAGASSGTSSGGANTSSGAIAGAPGSHVTLWTLGKSKRPRPVPVTIGYSDGTNVEITQGDVQAGEPIITGELRASATRANPTTGFGGGFGGGPGR
ncbi:MAG TPA: efflux RND transporter periplasmic adaptor subunit [Candidatus Eremiobacteraceae bacterium]|nr:efflux RND transporter periplasmic adaptor subunit [Candidatus Eremiobacteraceae bacterium]